MIANIWQAACARRACRNDTVTSVSYPKLPYYENQHCASVAGCFFTYRERGCDNQRFDPLEGALRTSPVHSRRIATAPCRPQYPIFGASIEPYLRGCAGPTGIDRLQRNLYLSNQSARRHRLRLLGASSIYVKSGKPA
jgi:hypothetical protein